MNLKPLNVGGMVEPTVKVNHNSLKPVQPSAVKPNTTIVVKNPKNIGKVLKANAITDPSGVLNNSVFSLIKFIRFKMILVFVFSLLIILGGISWAIANYFIIKPSWVGYLPQGIIILLSGYQFAIVIIEIKSLKRDVMKYRVDISNGLTSTPPFMIRIYSNMNMRQVSHNWYSFFIFFFGGIFLIAIYFLKSWSWWIFDFRNWIQAAFVNIELVEIIGVAILCGTIVLHFIFAFFRKKRIYQLDSYFGESIVNTESLINRKKSLNKFYRRIFYFTLLVIVVIPLIIWLILKVVKRKR